MNNYSRDDLQYEGFYYYQPQNGYRSSEDALILQNCILEKIGYKFEGEAVELGTGSGLISILLALKIKQIKINAIEIQKSLFKLARKNIIHCELGNKIKIIQADLRNIQNELESNRYDLCFANPPFFKRKEGKLNPNRQKQVARHEILCDMGDILSAFSYLLKTNKSGFLIYPLSRLSEFKNLLKSFKHLNLKDLRYFKNARHEIDVLLDGTTSKLSFCSEIEKV